MFIENTFEFEAKRFCDAIKELAKDDEKLDNLNWYLSNHFDKWLELYANTPSDMAREMLEFSKIGG